MIDQYTTITAAEAGQLWQLKDSTLRKAIAEKRLPASKSGGTWLVSTADMHRLYREPKPDTSDGTRYETFFVMNDTRPLEDIGRVPGGTGRHVLTDEAGSFYVVSGYFLRRLGEVWTDSIKEFTESE